MIDAKGYADEFMFNISSMTPDDFEKYQSDSTQKIVDICLRLLILEDCIEKMTKIVNE